MSTQSAPSEYSDDRRPACDAPLGRGPPRWLSGAATTERARRRRTDSATGRRRTPTALGRRRTPRGGARSSGRGAGRSWRPSLLQTKERIVRICLYVSTEIYILIWSGQPMWEPGPVRRQGLAGYSRGQTVLAGQKYRKRTQSPMALPTEPKCLTGTSGAMESHAGYPRVLAGYSQDTLRVLSQYSQCRLASGTCGVLSGPPGPPKGYHTVLSTQSGPGIRSGVLSESEGVLEGYSRGTR